MSLHRACQPFGVTLALCALAIGCSSEDDRGRIPGGDCVSYYDTVGTADSWMELKPKLLRYREWGRVASVRTLARGEDVGVGDQDAHRVVGLINRNDRRLVEVEIWRTETGMLRAGIWRQCID